MQTKNSEFLAKGTYGCVFYPSINACSGKIETDLDSDHYITKIQKYLPNQDDEIVIGKQIQTLPLYDHYFAPVVKSCKMNIAHMDYTLVRTCATLQNELGELNATSAYVSNKIRYVGKHHIAKYLQSLKSNPQKLYSKLINTHLHLLDALQLLDSENIVHFDIKPQNVMYDEIQDIPIIIDFGLSRSITPLLSTHFSSMRNANISSISERTGNYRNHSGESVSKKFEQLMRHTFASYDTYDYWCIDIYILSNIGSTTYLKPYQLVNIGQIKALLRGFMTPNFLTILSGDEVYRFKQRVLDYFLYFIQERQTWMDVFRELIQNHAKWDNYSAAITYLYSYIKAKPNVSSPSSIKSNIREPVEIQQYLSLLKNIVIAMPDERPFAQETQKNIREIFGYSSQETEYMIANKDKDDDDDDDDLFIDDV